MPNHFHLVLQLPDPRRLSALVAGLLVAYWHHYRRRHGLVGHLFQGRFKSPAIEAEAYLLSCGRYVERNPLEAGLVAVPWDYRWSSARAYALGEADALLAANPWYEALSPEPARRQALWRDFLLGDDPKEEAVRRDDWVIGGPAFRRRMQRRGARPAPRGRGRPARLGAAMPTLQQGTTAPSRRSWSGGPVC
jgi:putative transposase